MDLSVICEVTHLNIPVEYYLNNQPKNNIKCKRSSKLLYMSLKSLFLRISDMCKLAYFIQWRPFKQ